MESLQWFDGSLNAFPGTVSPLVEILASLRSFGLGQNNLKGRIPPKFGTLFNTTKILLSGNEMSETLPGTIGDLVSLGE